MLSSASPPTCLTIDTCQGPLRNILAAMHGNRDKAPHNEMGEVLMTAGLPHLVPTLFPQFLDYLSGRHLLRLVFPRAEAIRIIRKTPALLSIPPAPPRRRSARPSEGRGPASRAAKRLMQPRVKPGAAPIGDRSCASADGGSRSCRRCLHVATMPALPGAVRHYFAGTRCARRAFTLSLSAVATRRFSIRGGESLSSFP